MAIDLRSLKRVTLADSPRQAQPSPTVAHDSGDSHDAADCELCAQIQSQLAAGGDADAAGGPVADLEAIRETAAAAVAAAVPVVPPNADADADADAAAADTAAGEGPEADEPDAGPDADTARNAVPDVDDRDPALDAVPDVDPAPDAVPDVDPALDAVPEVDPALDAGLDTQAEPGRPAEPEPAAAVDAEPPAGPSQLRRLTVVAVCAAAALVTAGVVVFAVLADHSSSTTPKAQASAAGSIAARSIAVSGSPGPTAALRGAVGRRRGELGQHPTAA